MSEIGLLFCLLLPATLAAALWIPAAGWLALLLAPWAALPALMLAVLAPDFRFEITWILLGVELGVNEVRRLFLLLAAGLWTAAGVYAGAYHSDDPHRRRYFTCHLLALTGNLGLVVALDAPSFYLSFVLMSFAAYGMVVHAGTEEARRAARIYIVLVLVGEAMILPGLWSAVSYATSTALSDVASGVLRAGPFTFTLIALGFGVKAGVVPLHFWLPLAHPAAPTPASAVLSGAMIKAGVIAWIVLLPVGQSPMEVAGTIFIVGGFINALFGALVGVTQSRPKTVLAYSSVSQMGFVMIAIGVALMVPEAAPAALFAAAAYCLHHGVAKGALFLGVDMIERTQPGRLRIWSLSCLAIPALALAGAPLTSGFGAKILLKETAYGLGEPVVDLLLGLAAMGTTLLMIRFLALMADQPEKAPGGPLAMRASWALLIGAGVAAALLPGSALAAWHGLAVLTLLWSALWPMMAGILVAVVAAAIARSARTLPMIPEGDVVVPMTRALAAAGALIRISDERANAWIKARREAAEARSLRLRRRLVMGGLRIEKAFSRNAVVALNLMGLLGLLVLLAVLGQRG